MNGETMRATLRVTKALADLQRVRILMMLGPGELCVCQIVEVLGLAPSTISKHLSVLSGAGLVDSRKEGRWMLPRRQRLRVFAAAENRRGRVVAADRRLKQSLDKRKDRKREHKCRNGW